MLNGSARQALLWPLAPRLMLGLFTPPYTYD